MNELVSIVIPVYNKEKHIKKCIDSVINQTYKNIELLIIDDGSTDNSGKIISEYNDERIKYFKNNNQGIGKTRNFGIKKSNGKYIMFLDSDDYLDTNIVKFMLNKILKDKLDMVVCDYYEVKNTKNNEIKIINFENCSIMDNPELLLSINLSPWNKIYKKSFILKNNIEFDEESKYEDVIFVIDALINAKKIGKIDKALYYYVINENSETSIRDEKVFDILKIIDKIRNKYKDIKYLNESIDKLTVRILTNYTIQQRYQKDRKIQKRFINDAFKYLKENIKDYKNKKYYKNRGILRSFIEKRRILSIIYCNIYRILVLNKKGE